MKYETIDEEQIKDIMEGRVPRPPRDWDDSNSSISMSSPRGQSPEKPAAPLTNPAGQH
jgi:cell division protease FtsH